MGKPGKCYVDPFKDKRVDMRNHEFETMSSYYMMGSNSRYILTKCMFVTMCLRDIMFVTDSYIVTIQKSS